MANTKAAKTTPITAKSSMLEIVLSKIGQTPEAKAKKQATRDVRKAEIAWKQEISAAEDQVDAASDVLEVANESVASSGTQIMTAKLKLKDAETDLAELQELFAIKFPN